MGQIANLFNLILTFPIFNCLIILYHLFGDFGLSILVLTLIIKLILFPLTLQQLKSTKATQALQPQMQEIKKKYANDQQAQAAALQTLYKEYGVNPLAGCLPLLIQLPVLYGLYFALSTGIKTDKLSDLNAHLYPFVPHFTYVPHFNLDWFTWLSFLNPILHVDWTWALPLNAADPSHVLPIVAGLATFIQLRMSQPKPVLKADGTPAPADPTQQSMKMMQYIMPFFTLFIAWNVASGLALYWTISSIFQAVQQYFVTGWGALLTKPNLKDLTGGSPATTSKGSTTSTARPAVVESTLANSKSSKNSQPISNARTTPKPAGTATGTNGTSGGSQYTRRQRNNGSASARRRNNTQRAR
ncbi:YidC/Oxa1 family membrane protein insertase [Dictyobacter arantiisoli]|uniref:Membrane insertase YidC/Oxa/ALB C-terminal domain-containing protein n=1 Tax=Dictyobacter arantiisoli TaxID=2014874 RepID=A0A5A5T6C0_9CHLR|nr:YidC/Oxa1 family membrane protein insertase [Dictyobacter arantiisoli]GCF06563.1 hypothetical protein KDI_01270 [Dictyobacter arantiisoli]